MERVNKRQTRCINRYIQVNMGLIYVVARYEGYVVPMVSYMGVWSVRGC